MITEETLRELHTKMALGHKALWSWLAEHPRAEKEDWPGWVEWKRYIYNMTDAGKVPRLVETDVFGRNKGNKIAWSLNPDNKAYCFGCMWVSLIKELMAPLERKVADCKKGGLCMIMWPKGEDCMAEGELYSLWMVGSYEKEELLLAKAISELPIREFPDDINLELTSKVKEEWRYL